MPNVRTSQLSAFLRISIRHCSIETHTSPSTWFEFAPGNSRNSETPRFVRTIRTDWSEWWQPWPLSTWQLRSWKQCGARGGRGGTRLRRLWAIHHRGLCRIAMDHPLLLLLPERMELSTSSRSLIGCFTTGKASLSRSKMVQTLIEEAWSLWWKKLDFKKFGGGCQGSGECVGAGWKCSRGCDFECGYAFLGC